MTLRLRFAALLPFLFLAGLVGGTALWLRAQQRQYTLDRQLIAALVHGNTCRALALVNEGADPNTPRTPPPAPSLKQLWNQLMNHSSPPANDGPTAFLLTCGAEWNRDTASAALQNATDDPRLVQSMLRHGANVNAQQASGWTLLFWALGCKKWNIVRVLLEYHADVKTKDCIGSTPLMTAAESDAPSDIIRLLIDHGADVNVRSNFGLTPLMLADWSPDNVHLLLERGADVNEQGELGNTALHTAVQDIVFGHGDDRVRDSIRQLIAHGADPNLANRDGDTALELARQAGLRDLVALLRPAGAKEESHSGLWTSKSRRNRSDVQACDQGEHR